MDSNVNEQEIQNEEEKGVTLGALFHMVVKHWKGLVVSLLACIVLALGYGFLIQKPEWSSTGTIIVMASADSQNTDEIPSTGTINSSNLSLSINLVPTLVDFINSNSVLSLVATDINSQFETTFTTKEIQSMVSAVARTYTSLEKSLYIDVTATTDNTELSKAIVDKTMKTAVALANDPESSFSTVFANSMTVTSYAGDGTNTATSKKIILLIGFVAGLVIGVAYGLIFELCNTHVVSAKELESITGLNNIGAIPDVEKSEREDRKNESK